MGRLVCVASSELLWPLWNGLVDPLTDAPTRVFGPMVFQSWLVAYLKKGHLQPNGGCSFLP